MKAIALIFLSFILFSCKTDPKPKGIGVVYDPKRKTPGELPIKPGDADKFKTLKRESDSAIYAKLLDFKKEAKKSKIQSLKIKKKSAVKLENVSKSYKNFVQNINLSDQKIKSFGNNDKNANNQETDNNSKYDLKKLDLTSIRVSLMAGHFRNSLLSIARNQPNNFNSLKGAKVVNTDSSGDEKYLCNVQFPASNYTQVIDPKGKTKNYVFANYLQTADIKEAQNMYKELVKLYTLTGLDGNVFSVEEIKTDLTKMTLMVPMVENSSQYSNLLIKIKSQTNYTISSENKIIKKLYNVGVYFETLDVEL